MAMLKAETGSWPIYRVKREKAQFKKKIISLAKGYKKSQLISPGVLIGNFISFFKEGKELKLARSQKMWMRGFQCPCLCSDPSNSTTRQNGPAILKVKCCAECFLEQSDSSESPSVTLLNMDNRLTIVWLYLLSPSLSRDISEPSRFPRSCFSFRLIPELVTG